MVDRRAVGVLGAAALVVVAATVVAALRLAALRREAGWHPPPASGVVPPPPLGAAPPPAAGAPRALPVDSSGCAPAEVQHFSAAMSLDSVARGGGVPIEALIDGLHLPAGVSRAAPLDALMRKHGFSLRDVERVVEDYRKHCD
jgi:hypothetical protein